MAAPRNIAGGPRFDLPSTTQSSEEVLAALGVHVPDAPPLPALGDPSALFDPACERHDPLVTLRHRKIRILSNYWHAGWAHAFPEMRLRSAAADALYSAADSLPERWGLAVFDAYRPLELQAELHDAAYADPTLPPGFIAEPLVPATTPPPHSTGGTVDCTLTIDGIPLALGTDFDDFSEFANTTAFENTPGVVRDLRRMLYAYMHDSGFIVLHCEWWHFEFGTRRWGAIRNEPAIYGRIDTPHR
jgi:zinc D-Ala-D-Ala dipeptidase